MFEAGYGIVAHRPKVDRHGAWGQLKSGFLADFETTVNWRNGLDVVFVRSLAS